MRNAFVIRLLDATGTRASWAGAADGAAGSGSLEQAAAAGAGQHVIAALPGAEVLLSPATVPTRNRQRLLQALPFALEDQLAAEVDTLHFAAGQRRGDQVDVAVIARAHLDAALEALSTAGIDPAVVTSDILCLPWQADEWTILLEDGRASVRTGAQAGFAAEAELLPSLLSAALNEVDAVPTRIRLLDAGAGEAATAALAASIDAVPVDVEVMTDAPALAMARQGNEDHLINLLQGAYARSGNTVLTWKHWRPAAIAVAALVAVQIGTLAVQYRDLSRRSDALRQETRQLYHQAFPQSHHVPRGRERLLMERKLAELRGNAGSESGLLVLLARSGTSLTGRSGIAIQSLEYRNGSLDLDLDAKDVRSLDTMKQQLEHAGLRAEIRSAATHDGGVSGRVRISGGAS